MTLLASFTHPVADSQRAFRLILKAMSEPGVVVSLPRLSAWENASPAASAVLMTLVDRDTPLYFNTLSVIDTLSESLRLHRNAPGKTATVIVEVAALNGGLTLRLSGPDLMEKRAVAPRLPESVLRYLRDDESYLRQNVDLIFTCEDRMMALPRTTQVQVC